jgi:alcohol dehydrogenase class IV
VTAATGIDAFVHCFEAYCAPGFHPMADGIALEGMRLVAAYLPRACAHGADLEARAQMLAAAAMGATAFQKGLGGVHALAHPVGSWFDTHHGLTNAVLLPYVMAFNRRAIEQKCATIARVLGLPNPGYDAMFEWVLELRRTLGIPHTLAEIGVGIDQAHVIGAEAEKDPSAGGNPIPVDAAALERIFRGAVLGQYPAAA